MIYCVRCSTILETHERCKRFIKLAEVNNLAFTIKEIRKYRTYPVVYFASGTEVHFITDAIYPRWCLGKTYQFFGDEDKKVYHSGAPAKNTKHRTESD